MVACGGMITAGPQIDFKARYSEIIRKPKAQENWTKQSGAGTVRHLNSADSARAPIETSCSRAYETSNPLVHDLCELECVSNSSADLAAGHNGFGASDTEYSPKIRLSKMTIHKIQLIPPSGQCLILRKLPHSINHIHPSSLKTSQPNLIRLTLHKPN